MRSPFEVLQTERGASIDEVKRAYRRQQLALQGRSQRGDRDAEEQLRGVNDAYANIKKLYDACDVLQIGHMADPEVARRACQRKLTELQLRRDLQADEERGRLHEALRTVVEMMQADTRQGRSAGGPAAPPGRDLTASIRLAWDDAFRGRQLDVVLDLGLHWGKRAVRLDVPPGCRVGHTWQIPGRGGEGSPPGTLVVVVGGILEHPVYRLDPLGDVHMRLRVSYADVYRGSTILVPGPWGELGVKLAAGDLRPLRLRGQGLREGRDGRRSGALLVELDVVYPPPGDPDLEDALARLQDLEPEPVAFTK